ncbi:MAG: glycosyltransferase family 4 protein [Bacteroidota bacterium]
MRVLFVSNYFPPEVNAPATRLYEHAKQWVADGGEVEVLTSVPNFPEGEVYAGYENRLTLEEHEGIEALRVPMYVAANEGGFKRIRSYLSFMRSAIQNARRVRQKPDIVVGTSPQFFCALAGYWIARRFGVPFVLEVRDLWPESVVAVGAMSRNWIIRFFEKVERYLYRHADHVVVVTDSFVDHVVRGGARRECVSVIKNGADLDRLREPLDETERAQVRSQHGWNGKFVAAYMGTIGMAHRADVLLKAAQRCEDPDIAWVVVGAGAERAALERRAAELALPNFYLVDKQPKERIFYYLAESDVSVVHLRDLPLFRTVIPSKLFEAMAFGTPIVLGVRGESKNLIDSSGAGLSVPPEDPEALVEAVLSLKQDRERYERAARDGQRFVAEHFDRRKLARRYWSLLEKVVDVGLTSREEKSVVVDQSATTPSSYASEPLSV